MNEFMAGVALGISEDLSELAVGERQGEVWRHQKDQGRQHVQEGKEPLALLVDDGFRSLVRRDVKEYSADIINLTRGIAEYLPLGLNPGNLAVFISGCDTPGRRICRS
jgi:hypothetical protein